MQLQSLCHAWHALALACGSVLAAGAAGADDGAGCANSHDYPTQARVEYVQECMMKSGGQLATLYQCACAIDRLAQHLSYDDFVEAATFARYSTLPGENSGIFRDPDRAKQLTRLYRSLEAEAYRACGLASPQ